LKKKTAKKTKKMPPKDTKISDVASPGKTAPSMSSRPIVVTNRSVLATDPMIVDASKAAAPDDVIAMTRRTAKTIEPVSADAQPVAAGPAKAALPILAPAEVAEPTPPVEPAKPMVTARKEETAASDAQSKAADAETEAVEDARVQKLEGLVASGTYAVPINAIQRKRSRMFVATMCLLALVLAVLLLDALLDVGVVSLPSIIPHTHLFSDI
jgi:anti-sigma28 factor (negative regulator of flagellin synthesis)